ncbi:MAG TPA: SpoIIE family protein phosphatase, partial [Patescibacteria group bacterium]|nr:SpoIIE family protein phosphatase [Patescibacteria group bacterium]
MKSLKAKFSLLIAILIIVVIGATSGVLVQQKRVELIGDIYTNSRAYGELTASDIVGVGTLYLPDKSFIPFQRDLTEILKKNSDTLGVKIFTFSGEVLYDYETEELTQYDGEARVVEDPTRIKSANASVLTTDGQVIYMKQVEAGVYDLVDENEQPIDGEIGSVQNMVFPVNNEFAVQYDISYANLTARLLAAAVNIGIIGAIGIFLSLLFGFMLASRVTKPLASLTDVVKVIAKGNFKKRAEIHSKDEVGQLAESVNKMAVDLEKATEARIYQERVAKELEIAGNIQKELLPKELPEIDGLDIAGELIPATEVGGDVYDIIQDSKGLSYFYVGDATGHGVPAGILSAITNAIITSTIDTGDVNKILINLNRVLRKKTAKNLFLTLLLMQYAGDGVLKYANAGHEKAVHFKAAEGTAVALESKGIALSMVDEMEG